MDNDELKGCLPSDPLPEEIARRAAEIRATWDDAEELKRRECPPLPWAVPTLVRRNAGGIGGAVRARPSRSAE